MIERHYRAAGGVVLHNKTVLVLRRESRDEWRLPKGHVEAGESDGEAALREVAEESGYDDLRLDGDLGVQHVVFDVFLGEGLGQHIDRLEHYFRMRLVSEHRIPRPPEDEKFDPRWVQIEEARSLLTFDTEKEWLERAISFGQPWSAVEHT